MTSRKKIIPKIKLQDIEDFLKLFSNTALEIENEYGISAIALLSQIALETGWGKHILKVYNKNNELIDSKNLFNIKASKDWTGEVGYRQVLEYYNNKKTYSKEYFKIYNSYKESFEDYINLIKNTKRYKEAWENRNNFEKYFECLKKAGYATDPEYAEKLKKIANNYFYEIIIEGE